MFQILIVFWFELVLCDFICFLKKKIHHGCFILLMFLKEPLGKVLDFFFKYFTTFS